MTPALAVLLCHPVPYLSVYYAEVARRADLRLRLFYGCDFGAAAYWDPGFHREVHWDVPLLEGYDHEFLPLPRRPRRMGFLEIDCPSVGERLERFAPDVLLLHGYAFRFLWRAASWSRSRGVPSMLFTDSNAARRIPLWKRILKDPVVRRFYARLDGALVTGEHNRGYHRRYGIPEDRLFPGLLPVTTPGLSFATPEDRGRARALARERLGLAEGTFTVLYLGKFVEHKRPGDVIEATRILASDGKPLHVLLAGDGPLRTVLEEAARSVPRGAIRFTGFLNQSEIATPMLAADVLVLPSERDALGAVVGEALLAGVPSVVSDRVGCLSPGGFAREGVSAVSYRCGDVAALAAALRRLRDDLGFRGRLAAGAAALGPSVGPPEAGRRLAEAVHGLVAMGPRSSPVRAGARS